ncbi:MAG: tetratricopeptide repeat protein [Candidatus Doudnabacteria bacterium]
MLIILPYQTLVNIIFILSVVGAIVLVLRRLPEATSSQSHDASGNKNLGQSKNISGAIAANKVELLNKGLPLQSLSKLKLILAKQWHWFSQFLLEAKGLKHSPKINYGVKKIASQDQLKADDKPAVVIQDEQYYIDLIKRNPKDKTYYDLLGNFYFENKKFTDAANVYEYLTEHSPTKSEFWAKLGFANLYLQKFPPAIQAYKKSLELDPSFPGRYYNLALAYRGQEEWQLAFEAIKQAVELEANNQKYNDLMFELKTKVSSLAVDKI